MSAFQPISPRAALQLLEASDAGVDCARLLADLAEAGTVKGYARLVEITSPGIATTEVRDGRIDREIWKRVVAEDKVADVFGVGSVRLGVEGASSVSVLGIRFDEKSVKAAASEHGFERGAPVLMSKPPHVELACSHSAAVVEVAPPAPVTADPPRRLLPPDAVATSVDDAAAILGLSRGTVYKLLDAGTLQSKKVGGRRLVSADSIRALMA